jgi:short-subunit dehydrogenase
MEQIKGRRALVTGASSGMGTAFARVLASWGADLVITARRRVRLEQVAAEIRGASGAKVTLVEADLSRPGSAAALWEAATADGPIDVLVNNAGFGLYERYPDGPWERQAEMIQLNVTSLAELAHRFTSAALAHERRAWMLNVASIAAFQAVPYMANYAGTKAYVHVFSESLAHELRGTNVSVTCLCPGGVHTEFSDVAGQNLDDMGRVAHASMMQPMEVAERGLRAMLRGRRTVVTGGINRFNSFMLRFLPRRVPASISVKVLGKPAPAALPPGTRER